MRTVTYQSSRQSSNHVKVHSGNAVRNYKSRYGKGIRPTYTVLQIKADSPVNGADVFWYEGNCSILGSKNVYIGYNDNSMSVLSQFELIMTIISGAFYYYMQFQHGCSVRKIHMAGSFSGSLNFDRSCSLSFVWIFYYVRMVSHNDNRNDSASKK